jgi:hypothetical protein
MWQCLYPQDCVLTGIYGPQINYNYNYNHNTYTELVIAGPHGMTPNIQVEYSWQSCSRIGHHDEVGLGAEPIIWVCIIQYIVATSPVAQFWLHNKLYQLLGHLSPACKACLPYNSRISTLPTLEYHFKRISKNFYVVEHLERLKATANKNNTVRFELLQHCCWRF